MSILGNSNMTSGFIDLATFDEQEKYMYGGPDSTAYFVRETRKSTWFTTVPVTLSRSSGTPGFGQEWSVAISRAGDYLLNTWLRVTIPAVTLNAANSIGADGRLRWTRNLMHNLIEECAITFNDLTAARFDNYHLDFWAAFTVPAGKQTGYNNMIGNTDDLIQPVASGTAIPSRTLNLPLPFFFSRDSGVALPTAALPYNEMRISFKFRDWNQLLILSDSTPAAGVNPNSAPVLADIGGTAPVLGTTQVWGEYAIVSNEERQLMGSAPRDILIEQVQTAPLQTFAPLTNTQPQYDIRFSHSVKALFFAVRNTSCASEWSNYTAASAVPDAAIVDFSPSNALDPIQDTSLVYESTNRLTQMGSDYFSLIQPYLHAPVVPTETGYHMYSYSLDFYALDPMGSTNYGKLTNVSLIPRVSTAATTGAGGTGAFAPDDSGASYAQTFSFVVTALNNNVIRVSGGESCASKSMSPFKLGQTAC